MAWRSSVSSALFDRGGLEAMTANESGGELQVTAGGEPGTVLPETAVQLAEIERLQQSLADAEERARTNWEQYLRAVAGLENVRKRARPDIEAATRYGR